MRLSIIGHGPSWGCLIRNAAYTVLGCRTVLAAKRRCKPGFPTDPFLAELVNSGNVAAPIDNRKLEEGVAGGTAAPLEGGVVGRELIDPSQRERHE